LVALEKRDTAHYIQRRSGVPREISNASHPLTSPLFCLATLYAC
jgi:hypothetical protein